MRNPVERVISHYFFNKNMPHNPIRIAPVTGTLTEWIDLFPAVNNLMTKQLSGISADADQGWWNGIATIQQFELAKSNLRQFAFVGIFEHLDHTLELASKWLGLQSGAGHKFPHLHQGQRKEPVDRSVRIQIENLNWMDMELYRIGLAMFLKVAERNVSVAVGLS